MLQGRLYLAKNQIDFMVIATYLKENLSERYRTMGPPNIGNFLNDLDSFSKTSVSITQRAKHLREMDERWTSAFSKEIDEDIDSKPDSAPDEASGAPPSEPAGNGRR